MPINSSKSMPYFQYREGSAQSPTIPSKMIKGLSHSSRVQSTNDFLSAPKRKRETNDDDDTSASRQLDDGDDFVYPIRKRTASFCTASHDSEHREGPAGDSDVLDDETQALVKSFRTSIYRQEPPSAAASRLRHSPFYKEDDADDDDDDDDNCCSAMDFPTIGRARTISDSDESDGFYEDPPDMADTSRPVEEILEQDEDDRDWNSSSLSLDYNREEEADEEPVEEARERPIWLSSSTVAAGPSQPSPLWNMTPKKESFSPAGWTGLFHQGSA